MAYEETLKVKFKGDTSDLDQGLKNTQKRFSGLKKTAQGLGLNKAFNSRAAARELDQLNRQIALNQSKLEQYAKRMRELQRTISSPPKVDTRAQQAELERLINQVDHVNARLETIRAKIADAELFPHITRNEKQIKDLEKLRTEELRLVDTSERTVDKINKLEAAISSAKLNNPALAKARQEYAGLEQSVLRTEKSTTAAEKRIESINNAMERAGKSGSSMASGLKRVEKQSLRLKNPLDIVSKAIMQAAKRIFLLGVAYKSLRGASQYLTSALKTNRQFTDSLNAVKVNLATAFQPIYDHILPALYSLMNALAKATQYVAAFISTLFGKTYSQAKQAATELDAAKKAMEGYGGAAEEAKGQLASFDKFNDITPQKDGGGGSTDGGMDFAPVEEPQFTWTDKFVEKLGQIKEFFKPFTNELAKLWDTLKEIGGFAWQGLLDFYGKFLKPVGEWMFGEDSGLTRFVRVLREGLEAINWQTILDALGRLWEALAPFAIKVGEGLLWLWDNVLVPFGTWVGNEVVPRFLDILSGAIKVATAVIDALKPGAIWLWETFLKPIAQWTGGVIVSVLEKLGETLGKIGDWISDHSGAVEAFAIIAGSFAAAWGLVNVAIGLWNVIGVVATAVTTAFGAAVAFLTSPIGIVTLAIGALIAIVVLLVKHWDEVKEFAAKAWEDIKTAWHAAGEWFDTTIWQPIKKGFSGFWDGIKETASTAWNGVKGAWNKASSWFKDSVTTPIADFFSGAWDDVKKGASTAWDGVKKAWNVSSSWYKQTVIDPQLKLFSSLWKDITTGSTDTWDGIKKAWNTAATWFNNTIVSPIANFFGSLWEGVKSGASTLADFMEDKVIQPVIEGFKKLYNSVVGVIESLINGFIKIINSFIKGINRVIETINEIPGVSLSTISTMGSVSVPRLAKGGLAYGQVQAIVGDNFGARQNPEVISPLADLQQIMVAAMLQKEIATGGRGNEFPVMLTLPDGTVLVDLMIDPVNRTAKNRGYQAVFRPL